MNRYFLLSLVSFVAILFLGGFVLTNAPAARNDFYLMPDFKTDSYESLKTLTGIFRKDRLSDDNASPAVSNQTKENHNPAKNQGSPPVANPDFFTGHGSIDTINIQPPGGVLANDYDPDGGTVQVVYKNFQTNIGSGVILDNGRVGFNGIAPYNGTVIVPYDVCDADGCSSSTVTLTIYNHGPVANADSYTFHGNLDTQGMQIPGLLANDSDPDGDGLGIPGNSLFQTPLGQAAIDNTGRASFVPSTGETGSVTIPYTVCDNFQECTNSTVTFNSINNKPIAGADFYVVGDDILDTLTSGLPGILANDSDPDGDVFYNLPVSYVTPLGYIATEQNGRAQFARSSPQGGVIDSPYTLRDGLGGTAQGNITFLVMPQDGAANAGATCSLQSVGRPVNVSNGNMWVRQSDYNLPGIGENIEVSRTYNSVIQTSGLFGFGWSSKYDESIWYYDDKMIRLNMPDGKAVYFGRKTTTAPFAALSSEVYGNVVKNTDNTYTLTFKDGRIHKFNAGGRLLWQKDRNGNQTTLNYDGGGNLSGITDSFNRTLTVTPNGNGTVDHISDSIGTVATYEYYPGTNLLKTVTYADGSKYKYEYDTTTVNGKIFLKTVKDALDNVLETHAYDSQGRATTSEKAGGAENYTLDYAHINDSIPYTTVTDALGRTTKYTYDKLKGRNIITKVEGNCNCGSGSQTTNYQYDNQLNLVKKVDALGREMTYTYDGNGNRLTMTDVLGAETYTYNGFGEALKRTDRMGGETINTYNAAGNLLTTKDALNQTTTLTYKPNGLPETVKDALNHTTTLTYDNYGRLTQVKDANNKTTAYDYDVRARLTGTTNALNQTTTFQYDLNDRPKKIIYADANFEEYTYDLAGRRTKMKDARGNETTYGYDAAYRLISITDALSHTTTFGYDLMSNRISQTDALTNATNYEYDEFNRLKKIKYPAATIGGTRLEEQLEYDTLGNVKKRIDTANRETLYDYDTANRLIKTTDANLQPTQFEYNPRSQMTKVTDALNQIYNFSYDALGRQLSQTRAGTTMSYEYDAVGNRTKRTDYSGRQTTYAYDVLNRLMQINYLQSYGGIAPLTPIKAASYNYDDLSRLMTATNDAGTVSFTYDNRSRIASTTDVFGHLINYSYDANGNRSQLKLDGTVHTGYAYDVANRLTTLTDEASQNFSFGYDIANRLISKSLPNSVSSTYDYDGMSRLTRLKNQSSTATLTDNNFNYNPANQINQIAELTQTKNYAYDTVDRLTAMTNGAANETYAFDSVGNRTSSQRSNAYGYQPNNKLTTTQNATYSYDANGNMLSKFDASGNWIYGWDYENRMISARKQNKVVRYQYDALGRRVSRMGKAVGATAKYTYDGLDVVMDDGSEGIVKYQNGLGIDNKLKMVANGQAKYFLQDHLGSTVGLTDSNGAVVSSASYDSFGNSTNNLTTRYQYTGREKDDFTGLNYYRARWYDANLGRFVSEDPIGFAGGDINIYGYVKNRPLKRKDPKGLDDGDMNPNPFDDSDSRNPSFDYDAYFDRLKDQSNDYLKYQNSLPENPQCGPAGHPVIEFFVPDRVGGVLGPLSSAYNITPPCEAHDTCYSTCGKSKAQCDIQLGKDVENLCLQGGGISAACSFYGNGYHWGVDKFGGGAYQSAQEQSGCPCSLPSPPPDPCSKFGDWRCK